MDNSMRDSRSKNSRSRNAAPSVNGSNLNIKIKNGESIHGGSFRSDVVHGGNSRKAKKRKTNRNAASKNNVTLNLNTTNSSNNRIHSRNKSRSKIRKSIEKKRFFTREDRWYLITTVYLLVAAGVLQVVARQIVGFGQWYATHIYPVIVNVWGRICGIFPFSVLEIGGYLVLAGLLVYGIYHRKEGGRIISRMVFILGLLAFIYTTNCGINYYRRPFSSYLDLEVRESSVEELTALCQFLTDKVNETVDKTTMERGWPKEARECMQELGEQYPELGGYYPVPKPLTVSRILSVQQLCGVYAPFTVEANFNQEMTTYNIPHTMCHELSHLKGFMREDEANFIGYLACLKSDRRSFQYSGYLTGWVYATNALAKQDMDKYVELYRQLNEDTVRNLKENTEFWNQYDGKVAEASNKLNDTYLKMNDQQDGVKSYGQMVDLMLAYYRENQ